MNIVTLRRRAWLLAVCLVTLSFLVMVSAAQARGPMPFRSHNGGGAWTTPSTWEYCSNGQWYDSTSYTPAGLDDVTIRSGDTVTASY